MCKSKIIRLLCTYLNAAVLRPQTAGCGFMIFFFKTPKLATFFGVFVNNSIKLLIINKICKFSREIFKFFFVLFALNPYLIFRREREKQQSKKRARAKERSNALKHIVSCCKQQLPFKGTSLNLNKCCPVCRISGSVRITM